jgi:hypothetical protein
MQTSLQKQIRRNKMKTTLLVIVAATLFGCAAQYPQMDGTSKGMYPAHDQGQQATPTQYHRSTSHGGEN